MSSPQPPFYDIDWNDNDHLEKTPLATKLLYEGQFEVDEWIRKNAGLKIFSLHMLTEFHRVLFEAVWPEFAGKLRGHGSNQIPRNVSIGDIAPGVQAGDVLYQTERLVEKTKYSIQQLDDRLRYLEPAVAIESARNIAASLHCDLIRIHSFVNGNGRTARACVNYVGQRYGMRFIRFGNSPRGEYQDAVRTYIRQNRSFQHFADFLIPHWNERTWIS